MDEKQHEKESKQFREETAKYRGEMRSRDQALHGENHGWEVDYRTGSLKDR